MVRSRQLFLRSRLELAAELEQNAPGDDDSLRTIIFFYSLLFINLPFAFVYGPTYLFVKLTSGEAAAERYMPDSLLKTAVPSESDDDDADWKGRVLDVEKRTKALLKPVVAKMDEMQTKMDKMDEMQTKMDELHAKVDRMQAENKQMRAENEARAKVTEEKLDLLVSLMKSRA